MAIPLSLLLLCAVCSLHLAHGVPETGHVACPDGWQEHEGDCLALIERSGTWESASQSCQQKGAHLAAILTVPRNDFIRDLIRGASGPAWIGLRKHQYQPPYWKETNGNIAMTVALWKDSPPSNQRYAVAIGQDGLWTGAEYSSTMNSYVCEIKPDCAYGWTGARCDTRCRCASYRCGKVYSECPYGCQLGWMGSKCQQEKREAEVAYYCQNSSDSGARLRLRIDTKGVNYADVRSLNGEGQVEQGCAMSDFKPTTSPAALSLTVNLGSDQRCQGSKVKNTTSTYSWRFWLSEFSGVLSHRDLFFSITCDFTEVDSMRRATRGEISSVPTQNLVPLNQSHEEVKLMVAYPDTASNLRPLTEAEMGTRVRLVMFLKRQPGVHAKGISPKNCRVSAADGSTTLDITNARGCATSETPISKLSGNGSLVQTEVFSIFSFRQAQDLVFTCNFDFCFSDSDQTCTDRCARNSGRRRRHRGRRSAGAAESKAKVASTFFRVLPAQHREDMPGKEKGAASLTSALSVVAVVMATLVLTSLSLLMAWGLKSRVGRQSGKLVPAPLPPGESE